jgi:hypothetical protein
MYGLPCEYDAPVNDWLEVLSFLEGMIRTGTPVVAEVRYKDGEKCAQFRGKLRKVPGAQENPGLFQVGEYVSDSSVAGTGAASYLVLDEQRFAAGRLKTYDGDDYFFLALDMRDLTVLLMDSNSH